MSAHAVSEVRLEHAPAQGVRWHEYADIFPWLEGEPRNALKEDIRKNGVLEPIVFLDEAILDGRNRYDVARELGIEYPAVDFLGDDPLGFVIAKNLTRRHLSESQRSMVAKRLETYKQGDNRHSVADMPIGMSRERAADMLNVGVRSVARAAEVIEQGVPALVAAVDAGAVSVSAAAEVATLTKPEQEEIVARGEAEIVKAAKAIRARKAEERKEVRTAREAELAEKQRALPDQRYGVIVADPEWRFEPWSRDSGMDRAADNHYPTSELTDIAARDVASIAADDCVLFLWSTAPMQPQAFEVMKAWGFTYKSQAIWRKDRTGTGYWFRNEHEVVLVGTRGNIPAPSPGTQWASVIDAPVGAHSAKPEKLLELVEAYFPNLPKIELNRRGPARPGWDAWGNEAEPAEVAA